eukprot:4186775-Pleurochrysis_carterae.AAC.1
MATQSRCACPPITSCVGSCAPARHPRAVPVACRVTAQPLRKCGRSSGKTCDKLHSLLYQRGRPTSVDPPFACRRQLALHLGKHECALARWAA